MLRFTAAAAALSLQALLPAQALTLWNNGAPAVTNLGGSQMSDTRQAADFVLSSASNLTAITYWSLEATPADYRGSVFYELFSNVAGTPGPVALASGLATPTRTAAGTVLGNALFQNDFSVTVSNLAAGIYWLSLHNGPISSASYTDFYWAWTDLNAINTPTMRGLEREIGLLNWSTTSQEYAFLVTGVAVIPEPATMLLAAMGVMGLLAVRRRQA